MPCNYSGIIYAIIVGLCNGITVAVYIAVIILIAVVVAVAVAGIIGVSVIVAGGRTAVAVAGAGLLLDGINGHITVGRLPVAARDSHGMGRDTGTRVGINGIIS